MNEISRAWKRLGGEAAWVFAGQVLAALGTLVGLRLVTEAVPPSVYGGVVLATGIVALAQGLAVQPMMQAVLRFHPEYRGVNGEATLRRTAIGALRRPVLYVSGALIVVLGVWSGLGHGGFALGSACAVLFVIDSLRTAEVSFLNAARKQAAMSQLVVADAWLRPVFAVAVVSIVGARADAVVAGYALGAGLTLLGFYALTRRNGGAQAAPMLPPDDGATRSRLWVYARPLMILPLIGWVTSQADRYIVGGLVGLQYAGLYAAIYALTSRPFLMIGGSVELVLRQIYYARVSEGDTFRQRRVLVFWLAVVGGAALLLLLAIILLHEQIAALLLAAPYRTYSALMIPIAAGYVLALLGQVVERVCYALHDTRGVLLVEASGAALSVALGILLVLKFGIQGAAWAVPIYFGLQLCLTIWRANYTSHRWRTASQQ